MKKIFRKLCVLVNMSYTTNDKRKEFLARRQKYASGCVKNLRKNATKYEKIFYTKLKQLYPGVIFQKAFVSTSKIYIVDFFIPSKGIIIELDGSEHYKGDKIKDDAFRDYELRELGYRLFRIRNTEADFIDIQTLINNR